MNKKVAAFNKAKMAAAVGLALTSGVFVGNTTFAFGVDTEGAGNNEPIVTPESGNNGTTEKPTTDGVQPDGNGETEKPSDGDNETCDANVDKNFKDAQNEKDLAKTQLDKTTDTVEVYEKDLKDTKDKNAETEKADNARVEENTAKVEQADKDVDAATAKQAEEEATLDKMKADKEKGEVSYNTDESTWSEAEHDRAVAVMIAEKVNHYRELAGLDALPFVDNQAYDEAVAYSHLMADKNDFNHDLSDHTYFNENIAYTTRNFDNANAAADYFFNAWKESAGHNDNFLNGTVMAQTVGLYRDKSNNRYYATWRGHAKNSENATIIGGESTYTDKDLFNIIPTKSIGGADVLAGVTYDKATDKSSSGKGGNRTKQEGFDASKTNNEGAALPKKAGITDEDIAAQQKKVDEAKKAVEAAKAAQTEANKALEESKQTAADNKAAGEAEVAEQERRLEDAKAQKAEAQKRYDEAVKAYEAAKAAYNECHPDKPIVDPEPTPEPTPDPEPQPTPDPEPVVPNPEPAPTPEPDPSPVIPGNGDDGVNPVPPVVDNGDTVVDDAVVNPGVNSGVCDAVIENIDGKFFLCMGGKTIELKGDVDTVCEKGEVAEKVAHKKLPKTADDVAGVAGAASLGIFGAALAGLGFKKRKGGSHFAS